MSMLRVLVADDELAARERLEDLLAGERGVVVTASCGDPFQAVEAIRAGGLDAVFLDVQMPGLSGFDVVREVGPARMPPVVFVTAYDQYAVRAFESAAVDYLLKPFDDDRFAEALQRVRDRIRLREVDELAGRLRMLLAGQPPAMPSETAPSGPPSGYRTRFVVETGGHRLLVPVESVDYMEAEGAYVRLHTEAKVFLVRERMYTLEGELDPRYFCRIHRSVIVRLDRIAALEPLFRGDYVVKLRDGAKLRLSRDRRDELASRLGVEL